MKNCIYKTGEYSQNAEADYILDIQNINLPDRSFDFVICNHILEHVTDDNRAIRELYRILKEKGAAFIQVPLDIKRETTFEDPSIVTPQEREKYFGQDDHIRVYGLDLTQKLKKHGFDVTYVDFWNRLTERELFYYGLTDYEPVFICKKSK
jgi:SAM-dependent methyltransferase